MLRESKTGTSGDNLSLTGISHAIVVARKCHKNSDTKQAGKGVSAGLVLIGDSQLASVPGRLNASFRIRPQGTI